MVAPGSSNALIADIGGTNARFALAEPVADGTPRLFDVRSLPTAGFRTLAEAVEAYLDMVKPRQRPRLGAAAVAGPVTGDRIVLTNEVWTFSVAQARRQLHLDRLEIMNDFAAIARSLPHLQADHLQPVGKANLRPGRLTTGIMATVGPGTGLGMGVLIDRGGEAHPVASEGGHIGFAPQDPLEAEISRYLLDRFPHVSCERLISGPGLGNLYRALACIEGRQAEDLTPAEIAERGVAGTDSLCRHAMTRFCAILGSFAGDVALMFCADSIYIAGGMVPRFLSFLEESEFRARFEAKGRFREFMRSIPTNVILHQQPGLLGAAAALFPAAPARRREVNR